MPITLWLYVVYLFFVDAFFALSFISYFILINFIFVCFCTLSYLYLYFVLFVLFTSYTSISKVLCLFSSVKPYSRWRPLLDRSPAQIHNRNFTSTRSPLPALQSVILVWPATESTGDEVTECFGGKSLRDRRKAGPSGSPGREGVHFVQKDPPPALRRTCNESSVVWRGLPQSLGLSQSSENVLLCVPRTSSSHQFRSCASPI